MITLLTSTSDSTNSSSSESLESFKKLFTNPIPYIIIGSIFLLIIVLYFIKRFIKAKPNSATIVIRRGKVYKVLDENNPNCFLVPFADSIGAVISKEEKTFNSDQLFINDGPDALYKINYTIKYKVINPKEFYKYMDNFQNLLPIKINDQLRFFADQGNALLLVKSYRENVGLIIKTINEAVSSFSIEVNEFKINLIEPIRG